MYKELHKRRKCVNVECDSLNIIFTAIYSVTADSCYFLEKENIGEKNSMQESY